MSPPPTGPTAGILIIGEEILSGKVEEENARHLVRELRDLGMSVRRIEVVPDDVAEIVAAVRNMSARYDHVFTSGGVDRRTTTSPCPRWQRPSRCSCNGGQSWRR